MLVRIGLLTEGGYPYVSGDARLWCDRLVRGLEQHEFDIYALSRSERQEDEGWSGCRRRSAGSVRRRCGRPRTTGCVHGRRRAAAVRRGATGELAVGRCAEWPRPRRPGAGRSRRRGGPCRRRGGPFRHRAVRARRTRPRRGRAGRRAPLRSRRARPGARLPCARRAARGARGARPRSAHRRRRTWSAPCARSRSTGTRTTALGSVDLCHAAAGGPAALPGLLAHHFFGVPLLVTEYGVRLRAHYLAARRAATAPPPCAPCSRPSTAGWPPRCTGRPRSSPPATRTPGAGRSAAAPTAAEAAHRLPGHGRAPASRRWASRRSRRGPATRWSGSAASSPPRT